MDMLTHPPSTTEANPSSVQSGSHHSFSPNFPPLFRYDHQHTHDSFHTPIIKTPQRLSTSPWHTPSRGKYASPRLLPLIARFEALDAESLAFNIRNAQPPHLRLPSSKMGRRGQGSGAQQMKATREKLLTLFDRPGWSYRTLRGLRDGGGSRHLDEIPFDRERGPSRMQSLEMLNWVQSPGWEHDNEKWIPDARPGLRRESRIRDRIRLFDGGIDFIPSYNNGPPKWSRADFAVPSQSSTGCQPSFSPTKPALYSVFPPNHHTTALKPVKSYGYLRPKDATPLPWRPLDFRGWETVAQLTGSPHTPNSRDLLRGRVQHPLVTPTRANAASAVKKVQVTYQDPKRNVSEKVSVLYANRLKDGVQEQFMCERQENDTNDTLIPCKDVFDSPQIAKEGIDQEILVGAKPTNKIHESKSAERLKLAKESKIQDRINLFSKKRPDENNLTAPETRMRNQSTPTKLPSQVAYTKSTKAFNRPSQFNGNTGQQAEKCSAERIPVTAAENEVPETLVEGTADHQLSETYAPALRKSSGINDKIQQFEALTRGQAPSIGRAVVENVGRRSSSQSKRIQTWPISASKYTSNPKAEQTTVHGKSAGETQTNNRIVEVTNPTGSNSTPTKIEKMIRSHEERQRAKQKIQSRQERLIRRSRSRSRSAPNVSRNVDIYNEISGTGEHIEQAPEPEARMEKMSSGAKEASQQSKQSISVDLDSTMRQQHPTDERVQEIWINGGEDGPLQEAMVMDTVVAQCELAEPRPMRLAETLRMIRLCSGRFGERRGSWARKVRRTSEKESRAA